MRRIEVRRADPSARGAARPPAILGRGRPRGGRRPGAVRPGRAAAADPADGSPMPDLPTGTVTLLFTDIEGSTRLLQRLGERYAEVLDAHHRALRAAVAAHGGLEVDTQGDAFFVCFPRAVD